MKLNENTKVTLTIGQLKRLIKEGFYGWDPPETDYNNLANEIFKFASKLNNTQDSLFDLLDNTYDEATDSHTTLPDEDKETAMKYVDELLDGIPELIDDCENYNEHEDCEDYIDGLEEFLNTIKLLKEDIGRKITDEILNSFIDLTEDCPRGYDGREPDPNSYYDPEELASRAEDMWIRDQDRKYDRY